jgi:glycosyltransferase involved in cell wall biosynthesis
MAKRCLAIIPAFNEAGAVGDVIRAIQRERPDVDVAVVDDGSRDATAKVAREAGAIVLQLPFNLGIGGAVQTGYKYAWDNGYDIAIQVDADGQHPASEIGKVIAPIVNGAADMATGTRFRGVGDFKSSASRRIGIELFARLVSLIIREKVTDTTSGFRAVNRMGIALFSVDYPQDYPEVETQAIAHQHGLRLVEIPVQMKQRQAGESSIKLWGSAYYVVKVTLALLIGLFRAPTAVPEEDGRG